MINRIGIAQALVCVLALAAPATTCWGNAPSGKTKNILFIISDDLKASVLPAYGNQVCKTPNLDQLAVSGMVFERAYCQGLACAPSRPSFMRSIYPRSTASAPTIGEHFQQHGMHTARVGKVFHMPVPHTALSINNRGTAGGLRAANWHYMNYGDNGEELYDMIKDPHQYRNVANDPAYAQVLKQARVKFMARTEAAK